jgi:hypothetical protein
LLEGNAGMAAEFEAGRRARLNASLWLRPARKLPSRSKATIAGRRNIAV